MSRMPLLRRTIPLLAGLALAGCGKPAPADGHAAHDRNDHAHAGHGHGGHDEAEHGHAGEAGPVRFQEDSGLQLSAETSAALGLETETVAARTVRHTYELTASVFDAGPPARASSLVPAGIADDLERHPPAEARILAIHRELAPAMQQVEIVFAVPGNPPAGSTISLSLRGPAGTGPAVPRSALLRNATGSFVYVVRGEHLRRTPVNPGRDDGAYLEILDGIRTGDVVVTAGVEQLWLTELRLTKGGGHSH